MNKQRILKLLILGIAVLILVFCISAIPVEWYVYKYSEKNTDVTIKEYYNNVQSESKTSGHTTTTSYSYDDLDESHVKSLYEVMVVLTVFAIVAEFLVVVSMLINTLGRCCSTTIKMGLKLAKKILKKLAVIASIIVFVILFIAVVVFGVEHPKALSQDDEDGQCADSIVNNGYNQFCKDFSGDGFGPGAGWSLLLVSLILALPQIVLVWAYAYSCTCLKQATYNTIK